MQTPLSYLSIDTQALKTNAQALRGALPSDVRVAAVVKANAYGHGEAIVVPALENEVDYFQIDDIEEWRRVRPLTKKPILILGYVDSEHVPELIGTNTELAAFHLDHLRALNEAATEPLGVHLPFDCLLGREGFSPEMTQTLVAELPSLKNIRLSGLYAHFANVEDTDDPSHAENQVAVFTKIVDSFLDAGFRDLTVHHSSTAGSLVFESANRSFCNLVRLGIGLYGFWPAKRLASLPQAKTIALTPALSWTSRIITINVLPPGRTVGYGLTYKTTEETKVALVPQGYSDGYDRGLSNKGSVLVRGVRCPVIGRVSMNMFTVDVTNAGAFIDDLVTLIGTQENETITATELATLAGTIDYEIVARLSPLLPRISQLTP